MPKKSKKSESELANAYKERLAHAVNNGDKWLRKVSKMATSKKYPVSHEDREKIVNYLGESFQAMDTALNATGEPVATGFKL
jgi:hypothetical protein